jgi:hypothetical protein
MLMPQILWRAYQAISILLLLIVSAYAQQDVTVSPTREQLETQISILQDYIKKHETTGIADPGTAELQKAYVAAQKKEYEYLISEMDVTIAAYQTARIASDVVLALVVLVVVAGVGFAGFQLWKSVSVAGVQASSDLEISASKVRVTSSVVGIVVLIISLAFLYIYTKQIYGVEIVAAPPVQGAPQLSK